MSDWQDAIVLIDGEDALLGVAMEIVTGSSIDDIKGNYEAQTLAMKRGRQLAREAAARTGSYFWLANFPYLAQRAGYEVSDMDKRPVLVRQKS